MKKTHKQKSVYQKLIDVENRNEELLKEIAKCQQENDRLAKLNENLTNQVNEFNLLSDGEPWRTLNSTLIADNQYASKNTRKRGKKQSNNETTRQTRSQKKKKSN
jgi:hypothetical protein